MNRYEEATHDRLASVAAEWHAHTFPKVRLADILPIEGSGIADSDYRFALQAHFDFIVTDRDLQPLFAVEFDGPTHKDPKQVERDDRKSSLVDNFGLPLLRINARYLEPTGNGLDVLCWCIHAWFSTKNIEQAEREGLVKPGGVFPTDLLFLPNMSDPLPLFLSKSVLAEIKDIAQQTAGMDPIPSAFTAVDRSGGTHALAWLRMSPDTAIWTSIGMRSQAFDLPLEEVVEDLAIMGLRKQLEFVRAGVETLGSIDQLAEVVATFKSRYETTGYSGLGSPPSAG